MPKSIKIDLDSYLTIMRVIKYFMNLHPEYNEQLMDFYAELHDKSPVDIDKIMKHSIKEKGFELEQMIWDLGLSLPSWDDELPPYGDRSNNETSS